MSETPEVPAGPFAYPSGAPVAPSEPLVQAPAPVPDKDEAARLLEEAREHLAGGGGASAAVAVLIRAVELLAGL